nr:olfactory receptor 8 [Gregopimpla kuwanae]
MPFVGAFNHKSPAKPLNKFYKSDIESTIQYSRWFLQSLGLWPMISKNSSTIEKYISKCLIVICFVAMIYLIVPAALYIILKEKSTIGKVMRLGPLGACLSIIFKYVFIVFRCKTIKLCLEHMEYDWMTVEKDNEREIMTKNARVGRAVTIIACVFMYTGGMFYNMIMPLLKGNVINERNETIRPLVYPGFDIFVDPQKSPNYEIIFCTTCAAASVRYTVTIAACNLAAVFVSHTCGQIQIVISRLERLFDGIDGEQNGEKLQERISSLIQCHVNSLRLSARIDDVLQEICLIEVIAATFVICLLEYHLLMGWSNSETVSIITFFALLLSYIFNIFIFCYIGELLKEQCNQVGTSTYLIDWYRLPGKTGLAIVMIIAMSNYPRKITAGRMMDLSITSFGMIMKTSAAYLNMIRTMAD